MILLNVVGKNRLYNYAAFDFVKYSHPLNTICQARELTINHGYAELC